MEQSISTFEKINNLKDLEDFYIKECRDNPNVILSIIGNSNNYAFSTWLLKHHYDESGRVDSSDLLNIIDKLSKVESWEAKLHLLQTISLHGDFEESFIDTMEQFIRQNLSSENKFVKTWAIEAFYTLSKIQPFLLEELRFICEKAMETGTPAVKARVRKILQRMN